MYRFSPQQQVSLTFLICNEIKRVSVLTVMVCLVCFLYSFLIDMVLLVAIKMLHCFHSVFTEVASFR